ncbi:ABC-type transporter, periplasmic subunit family 3 [Desulfovibrio sp. X2]|uniref:PhnD/SsuA/transferrin family substrate-binding protein n=1 Tax=Desulfovibrio sp. X2 TaxID=941449 RepID=UPI000358B5A7|nr:PhnD/SsuA/transferrin family substrate-binding protein [Desulfovibrio sp. X2]EPR43834.1 ABC-type transporter, periplasmic subunit family 3 [Desulfovibrio sp. X2]
MRLHHIVVFFLLSLFVAAPAAQAAQTYKLAVTDLEGMEELQREFGAFGKVLGEKSGYTFELFPVNNRTAAVEALRARKVDFVITGPAEYVVFRKRTKAVPVVGFSRPDYFASVVVMADSGISSLSDLKGKKVAFGDVGSTSKHLTPMQIFADNGIDPLKDISPVYVDPKVGFAALKRGDVAAFCTTNGKFVSLRDKDSLPAGSFMVLARSRDLPNDILIAGSHVDAAVVKKLQKVFAEDSDALIKAILTGEDNQKYKGMKFLTAVNDRDYDYVRAMYATIGYPQYSEFVGN